MILLKKLLLFQLECVKEPLAILCPKDQWFGVKYSVVLHFTNMFIWGVDAKHAHNL